MAYRGTRLLTLYSLYLFQRLNYTFMIARSKEMFYLSYNESDINRLANLENTKNAEHCM